VRRRLDVEMVRRGIVGTRPEAAQAIRSGSVTVAGRPVAKASTLVSAGEPITVVGPARRFVSRGGDKLDAALDRFGIEVAGRRALDAGASTGGFTDCLLSRGAVHVVAVDVGYGQLDWRLRQDPRVTVLERTNVRDLRRGGLPYPPAIVVVDLSFISLRTVLPALVAAAHPAADFVLLVKPQFEAARDDVGAGGVVGDPDVWRRVLESVASGCRRAGLRPEDAMASPLLGPAGNVEFLLLARGSPPAKQEAVAAGEAPSGRTSAIASAIEGAVGEGIALRGGSRAATGEAAGAD
jgi:23S rRNA (cytidine1920-2'-O)/16S rRNA (cytidine1409-2'-O)-methyltransferase